MSRSRTNCRCLVSRSLFCVAIVLLGAGANQDAPPSPAPVSIPADVRQALEQNVTALSPISISWTRTRRPNMPIQEAVRIGKFHDESSFFDPEHVDFSRQDGKYNYLKRIDGTRRGSRFCNRFDGDSLYQSTGLENTGATPIIFVWGPEKLGKEKILIIGTEYFDQVGAKIYGDANTINKPDESLLLYLIGQGATPTRVDSAPVDGVVCRTIVLTGKNGSYQFHLDPAMNYALRKLVELTADGRTKRVTTNTQFRHYPDHRVWLPFESHTEWYNWSSMKDKTLSTPLFFEDFRVEKLEKLPLPNSEFVMDLRRPGALVSDTRVPGAEKQKYGEVQYQVPANLEYLDDVIDAASKGKKFVPRVTHPSRAKALVLVNIIILSVGALYVWRRSKR